MNATITADGTLVVRPENELEAYALGRWSAVNLTDWFNAARPAHVKLMVNCEQWPSSIEPVVIRTGSKP